MRYTATLQPIWDNQVLSAAARAEDLGRTLSRLLKDKRALDCPHQSFWYFAVDAAV
jgi:hypothetical protein